MEDRIRRLCAELLAKSGDEEIGPILVELREALHLQCLRERFSAYPLLVERRARNDISPTDNHDQEAAKETHPANPRT